MAYLYEFLARINKKVVTNVVQELTKSPLMLLNNPRIDEQLFQFEPHEVRRIFVKDYEIRYEIKKSIIYILSLWHSRQDR